MPAAPFRLRFRLRRALIRAAAILALPCLLSPAAAQDDRKAAAEARLAGVVQEITATQRQLEENRERHGEEQAALRALDLDLQASARRARELVGRRAEQEAAIAALEADRLEYLDQLMARSDELASQLLAAWRLGRESRLKLVMNQDSPARLQRLLAYYQYLSNAHGVRIRELRTTVARLDEMDLAIRRELDRLAAVEAEHLAAETELRSRREDKARLLADLESRLAQGQHRLDELARDREDLETLLERLNDALADIPADLGGRLHPTAQRGRLPMPVAGRVSHAFGQSRGAGLRWQGWQIGAPAGADVGAVAYGRVAYADWLRGYGLLVIIDHGDGFMSLYGQNESLLAEVGDWVRAGEAIATVGHGDSRTSGLYFELRSGGKAVDPAAWIERN